MHHVLRFTLLVAVVLSVSLGVAEDGQAYPCTGNEYHVNSSTGSDSNTGCSGSPWATLQFAMDSANAGDTIYVADGTYSTAPSSAPVINCVGSADSGTGSWESGVSGSPIIFRPEAPWDWGDGPAQVNLYSNADGVIRFDGCDFVHIHGFRVLGPSTTSSGTNIAVWKNSDYDLFSDGEVTGSLCQGVYTAEDPPGSDGPSFNFYLRRNLIHHNGSSPDAQGNGGCRNNANESIQSHGVYLEGDLHYVDNNLFAFNGHGFGVHVYDKGSNARVLQNTIVYNGGLRQCCGGMTIGGSTQVEFFYISSNIIAHNYGRGLRMESGISNTNCGTIHYNTFYDNGGNSNRPPARPDNWDSAWTSLSCWESNNVVADPGLVTDPWPKTTTLNWSDVYLSSFTIDAHLDGTYKDNAGPGLFTWDLDSVARCRGTGYDRGAYEYVEPQGVGCAP